MAITHNDQGIAEIICGKCDNYATRVVVIRTGPKSSRNETYCNGHLSHENTDVLLSYPIDYRDVDSDQHGDTVHRLMNETHHKVGRVLAKCIGGVPHRVTEYRRRAKGLEAGLDWRAACGVEATEWGPRRSRRNFIRVEGFATGGECATCWPHGFHAAADYPATVEIERSTHRPTDSTLIRDGVLHEIVKSTRTDKDTERATMRCGQVITYSLDFNTDQPNMIESSREHIERGGVPRCPGCSGFPAR